MVSTLQPRITYKQGVNPLFANMFTFRKTVDVVDFISSGTALDATTQYTSTGSKTRIMKNSVAPRGFDIIDTWIDFCMHIDRGEYREVIGMYYRLKRFLNI